VGAGQVWLPTDKNMAGCDNCSFWVHDHCDQGAMAALNTEGDIPYYCPPCRRQAEAHHQLQTLRQAEAQLRAAQPRRPRSAYHLFSLELHKCAPPHVFPLELPTCAHPLCSGCHLFLLGLHRCVHPPLLAYYLCSLVLHKWARPLYSRHLFFLVAQKTPCTIRGTRGLAPAACAVVITCMCACTQH
jgi:hypothetical protein